MEEDPPELSSQPSQAQFSHLKVSFVFASFVQRCSLKTVFRDLQAMCPSYFPCVFVHEARAQVPPERHVRVGVGPEGWPQG